MSAATHEALIEVHPPDAQEVLARAEQQAEHSHHHDEEHVHLEAAHGAEGHVCTTSCEHTHVQANEVSDNLFADLEKEHVCGANCEHHHTQANEISDSLFEDLLVPASEKSDHKAEASLAADTVAASKVAQELDHHHESSVHVCDAHCEHNQPQADKHADLLFAEIESVSAVEVSTSSEVIKQQLVEASRNFDVVSELEMVAWQLAEASETAQVTSTEATVAMPEQPESDETAPAVTPRVAEVNLPEDGLVELETSSVGDTRESPIAPPEELPIDKAIEMTQTEETVLTIDGQPELPITTDAQEMLFESASTGLESTNQIAPEQTSESFDFTNSVARIEEIIAPIDAGGQSDEESPTVFDGLEPTEVQVPVDAPETLPAQAAVVAELVSLVEPAKVVELRQVVDELLEQVQLVTQPEHQVSSTELVELQDKLNQLAERLSITYQDLVELIQLGDAGEQQLLFDQATQDILRGLKKELSLEYSLEFPQSSLSQPVAQGSPISRLLGQLILLFMARSRQPTLAS